MSEMKLEPFALHFGENKVFIIFEHERTLPGEGTSKAFLAVSIVKGKDLYFGLKVLQATNPSEVKRLIALLENELVTRSLTDSEKSILEWVIEILKDLSNKNLVLQKEG